MRSIMTLLAIFVLTFLSGCATNPYVEYYHDNLRGKPLADIPIVDSTPCNPQIYGSQNIKSDMHVLFEHNYLLIGAAVFHGPPTDNSKAIEQAKSVGACIVLLHSDYMGTRTSYIPWTTPNAPQTSNTMITGDINATATTTTYGGARTTYIPYSVSRYTYRAGFFVKAKPRVFGIDDTDLPPALRQQLQRNTGVYVAVVINGSPAYNANILEGDVITSFAGVDVMSAAQINPVVQQYAGERVNVIVIRNGTTKTFHVQLNKASY
ncbi:MAG: PDZ domain-containing protein [Gammaproteobacteria bacterium]